MDGHDLDQSGAIRSISEVLELHGEAALGDRPALAVAKEWIDAGFDDAEDVNDWLRARCFKAEHASRLEVAGIMPEQAGIKTTAGAADYQDTIGYKVSNDDLSIDEARRIITSEFWK